MTQLSGAFSVELDLDRVADLIAERVAARLAGSAVYERTDGQEPAPRITRPEDAAGFAVTRDGAVDPPADLGGTDGQG